ncbi:hypothetical protein H6P81_020826 [Aristolochia fimbriata]|uniref:Ribosomal protein S6 n=1 Tax=Aristolochia fimbriata TaxID=158543 RepID=A0AAV7DWP1_ARIFI|nr:hypothetical protein H6P81_020826 [Aristolochia fimbriata]
MPLYDCMLLLKPKVVKEAQKDLVKRIATHVFRRNGVLMDMRSFGNVYLGYGIKKLDGRYYQGTLLQMTMMVTPNFNKELQYLNKEDRLLRWLLVKYRGTPYLSDFGLRGMDFSELSKGNWRFSGRDFDADDNDDEDDEEDDEEYETGETN